ncbi:hypothetical protein JOD17_003372 [Geomicrobium sediminis]|uniref:DUF1541 domain-containing protein n=1 Tax=Geomicrobium sediminis TaxID=1347788 RepID=A0ABS2PGW3_9BACL|nr:hypothetical protein [Geomicrobium sediminis]
MTVEIPEDLKEEDNPTYEVVERVIIKANHIKGMKGAEAMIVGAYDTTAYEISYTPTIGGPRVKNHKWLIQEEIKDAGEEMLQPGQK